MSKQGETSHVVGALRREEGCGGPGVWDIAFREGLSPRGDIRAETWVIKRESFQRRENGRCKSPQWACAWHVGGTEEAQV